MRKRIASVIAILVPDIRFQKSLFWGMLVLIAILIGSELIIPLQETLRELQDMFFKLIGAKKFSYPGIEIPFTLLLIYIIGRTFLTIKDLLRWRRRSRGKDDKGVHVLYRRCGAFAPGLARGVMRNEGDLPHPYLVRVMISIRGIPDFALFDPGDVYVVLDMSTEKFMMCFASGGGISPSDCTTQLWEKWAQDHAGKQ